MTKGEYQRILAPVDGSRATPRVIERAIALAALHQAHLDILTVAQVGQLTDGYLTTALGDDQTYDLVKTTGERLDDVKETALAAGVPSASVHVRFGNPKDVIARDFPADHQTDLIVIGSTGLSVVERFIVGSVTGYVVRNAPCDVVVVRA